MKIKIDKKIVLASIVGIIAIFLLIAFENFTKTYFLKNNNILNSFHTLETLEIQLDYEVLESSFFLYKNFDAISQTEKKIDKAFEYIEKKGYLKSNHPDVYKKFLDYKKELNKKIEAVHDFESVNSSIKNSTMYLATLIRKIPNILEGENKKLPDYEKIVIETISSIFLAKNSFDEDFISDIEKNYNILKKYKFTDEKHKNFHTIFLSHLNLFIKNFPLYTKYLKEILTSKTKEKLKNTTSAFIKSANEELNFLTNLYIVLIIFYIGAILIILYLLFRIDKENIQLKKMQIKLEKMARIDPLTGLLNRRVLAGDKKNIKEPVFFIVNIDGFKHYNDFYGIKAGDFILKEVAKTLKNIIPKEAHAKFYRIGGDDFGILFNKDHLDIKKIAKNIVEYFKTHKIAYKNIDIYLSVSIGITTQRPLIETADMALKYVKKDIRRSYFIYNPNIGFYEKIKENIKKTKILKDAFDNDQIFPYFQPVFDPYKEKIINYEVLARIKNDKNEIESIFPYLQIAKETKLYENLTKTIFKKSFEYFKDKNIAFSLNISMEDIINPNVLKFLGNLFKNYPNLTKNITFEILESAAITDYDAVRDFVSIVKNMGAKISIDDFGSGYSNFEHILNLNIDYIKIDGSLIKDLPNNYNAELIVKTIKNFADEANIKTVAEFVHSYEVLEKIKELKIDYAQGFYLSVPIHKIKV